MIEQLTREHRADAVLKLAALPRERVEAILLRRGIADDIVAEVKEVLAEAAVVSVQPRVTNRTDYSGLEDRMAPAAATGASPRARQCFAPRSKASNTSPQVRRNR